MRRFRGRKMIEEVLGKLNAPRHPIQLDYSKLKTYKALTRSLNSLPTTISNNEQMINLEWFAMHSLHF